MSALQRVGRRKAVSRPAQTSDLPEQPIASAKRRNADSSGIYAVRKSSWARRGLEWTQPKPLCGSCSENERAGGRANRGLAPRHDLQIDRLLRRRLQRFLDERMRALTVDHLEFDEQWTSVGRKQARLTPNEKAELQSGPRLYLDVYRQANEIRNGFRHVRGLP